MSSPQSAMLDQQSSDQIRSRPCPNCFLCGAEGELLYERLKDRLFGAPGIWNFKRCPNPECGLLWLDPMPVEEDIARAYESYYTHIDSLPDGSKRSKRKFLTRISNSVYGFCLRVTSVQRERKRLASMYLADVPPGRALDVGCGDGSRLARLRTLGWDVQGQEMDPKAVSRARQVYGVRIHLGPLEQAGFVDGEFDAIVMNHVIEHVHDSVRLLAQCNRLLRKGGTFIAVTPNAESHGLKCFGSSWRGLEPPRHLHIFSQRTLRDVAGRAGFSRFETWTTAANADMLASGSVDIRAGGKKPSDFGPKLMRGLLILQYQLWWRLAHLKDRNSGEECVLKAAN